MNPRKLKHVLLNSYLYGSGLVMTSAVFNGERIFRSLARRDVHAPAVSRPNGLFRIRLNFHSLRVGHAIAKGAFLPGTNDRWVGSKNEDVKAIPAHHLEGLLILRALILCRLFCNGLIRFPPRIKNPSDV